MIAAFLLLFGSIFYPLHLSPGSFPQPLSQQEEAHYLRLAGQGDLEARNVLISHNLRLVAHIMKKYYAQASDQEDLISIGTIGLIKGITTFKPDKGVRLATYAARCVENEILMHFRSQKKSAQDVSLSDYIDTGSDGAALSLMDVVGDGPDLLEEMATAEQVGQLRKAVEVCLTEQERQVIVLRYGLGGGSPCRQREVAQRCGVSRSYVSRIEKRALEKLRRYLENGSYFRLSNLTLGYTFRNFGKWARNLRLYASFNNVFTITGYDGRDPEINLGGLEPGIDTRWDHYPRTRQFLLGATINF